MPVHFAGSASQLPKIYKFAKDNKLRVIEDATACIWYQGEWEKNW